MVIYNPESNQHSDGRDTEVSFTSETHWKEYCTSCKRNHIVSMQSCPSCGVYKTPQPVSEKVNDECNAYKMCNGCKAYQDHYN